jgi:hypothetical protein
MISAPLLPSFNRERYETALAALLVTVCNAAYQGVLN